MTLSETREIIPTLESDRVHLFLAERGFEKVHFPSRFVPKPAIVVVQEFMKTTIRDDANHRAFPSITRIENPRRIRAETGVYIFDYNGPTFYFAITPERILHLGTSDLDKQSRGIPYGTVYSGPIELFNELFNPEVPIRTY